MKLKIPRSEVECLFDLIASKALKASQIITRDIPIKNNSLM